MPKKIDQDLIVALDIGTNKIAALVGEVTPDNAINVIGFGVHPSRGLKKGVVVNIEATVQSIERAVEDAALMAGCDIQTVYAGIAGSHIASLNSHGIVAIRDREVSQSDVDRVIDAAKAVAIPADQKILHILPQEFIVDTQEGVREPIGMSGVRLEARVHIVSGAVSAVQNITKCVRRCGLQTADVILEPLASSYAVLTEDEKELGVCMVDIGGGTTDIAVFIDGAIRHTAVIPVGGDHVTNDVAVALRTPTKFAEQIKRQYASVAVHAIDPNDMISVPSVSDRPTQQVQRRALGDVVYARYEEIFSLVANELHRCGFADMINAGVVLTGGAANVAGIVELSESVFQMPVRIGLPQNISGLIDVREDPTYSTGVGLLLYGLQRQGAPEQVMLNRSLPGLWSRMRNWFQGNF